MIEMVRNAATKTQWHSNQLREFRVAGLAIALGNSNYLMLRRKLSPAHISVPLPLVTQEVRLSPASSEMPSSEG